MWKRFLKNCVIVRWLKKNNNSITPSLNIDFLVYSFSIRFWRGCRKKKKWVTVHFLRHYGIGWLFCSTQSTRCMQDRPLRWCEIFFWKLWILKDILLFFSSLTGRLHTLSLSVSLSLTFPLSFSLSLTRTHTRTHSQIVCLSHSTGCLVSFPISIMRSAFNRFPDFFVQAFKIVVNT